MAHQTQPAPSRRAGTPGRRLRSVITMLGLYTSLTVLAGCGSTGSAEPGTAVATPRATSSATSATVVGPVVHRPSASASGAPGGDAQATVAPGGDALATVAPGGDALAIVPPGASRVSYPDGTLVTWPAAASGGSWVDPGAGGLPASAAGGQLLRQLLTLMPGSRPAPDRSTYEEGRAATPTSYLAVVLDDAGPGPAPGAGAHRYLMVKLTRGGASILGSDFDRCGTWPGPGNSLGVEGLTPVRVDQLVPGTRETIHCSVGQAHGLTIVHSERTSSKTDGDPTSRAGLFRDAFTVRPDGTAVTVTSSGLADTGPTPAVRDWSTVDDVLAQVAYPAGG